MTFASRGVRDERSDLVGAMLWVDERGSGLVVVLLHNGVMDARAWDGQMEPFSRSHRVVRYDAPGFGRSDALMEDYRETDVLLALLDSDSSAALRSSETLAAVGSRSTLR